MKSCLAVLALALAAVAVPAAAQTRPNEVSLFGSWESINKPQDVTTGIIQLRYGHYFSPQIVGTLGLMYDKFSAPGSSSKFTAATIGGKYYFSPARAQSVVPFVDGDVGYATTDTGAGNDWNITWEFGGGVSLFLDDRTSVDGALRFFNTNTDSRTQGTRLFLGITTRF